VSQRHLLDVWNPSYASNAMEAHLAVLLTAADQFNKGESDVEPYVWWGKIRSPNRREQGLKHLPDILQIAGELESDDECDCNLYLTDYRSLYVGQVDAIVTEHVRTTDPVHVPTYYAENGLECDFWYRLLDLRRLVADDITMVISKLRSLRNRGYGGRPGSLYGGMVDLPLIVERADACRRGRRPPVCLHQGGGAVHLRGDVRGRRVVLGRQRIRSAGRRQLHRGVRRAGQGRLPA